MNSSKTTELTPHHTLSQAETLGITKFATLSPYLAEIQKRRKIKSTLRQTRSRSKNQVSAKSFRIKQKSLTSLHARSRQDLSSQTVLSIVAKIKDKKKEELPHPRQHSSSKQKTHAPTGTLVIKPDQKRGNSRNQTGETVQNRNKKGQSFRKNRFQSRSRNEDLLVVEAQKETIEVCKYGYTDTNRTRRPEDTIAVKKTTENLYGVDRKKFRRGKYEALYSSVHSNQAMHQKQASAGPIRSESRIQISKKQSNISINKDVDLMARDDMYNFYRQMRSNQIQKSLQKSTEKYFKQESVYRPAKTKNNIEIYISTAKNPATTRQSNASTLHTSEKQGSTFTASTQTRKQHNFLNYQFDFCEAESSFSGIAEIENPSEEDSLQFHEEGSFEKQRKKVEKEYFHKKSPHLDWSQEDCQIDEV